MTLPHQCRCVICGEIGTILPGLPNVFAPVIQKGDPGLHPLDEPPATGERRAIVPTETSHAPHWHERGGEACYAKSCYDPPYVEVATCTHGYTRCMPCKFPPP